MQLSHAYFSDFSFHKPLKQQFRWTVTARFLRILINIFAKKEAELTNSVIKHIELIYKFRLHKKAFWKSWLRVILANVIRVKVSSKTWGNCKDELLSLEEKWIGRV